MTNIAIGQYYPTKSHIHNLDARVKLAFTIAYIILLFFITNFLGYLFTALFLAITIKLSNVPFKFIFKGLRAIFVILIFTVVLNIFFTPGTKTLFEFSFIKITEEGLFTAIKMGSRLMFLVMGSSLLTLTTSPIQLTDAIEFLLAPFKKIGLPSHEIAMMMTIALRFIPTLLEETDKIIKAQKARGADFDTGGILKKAKGLIPILVPLFVSAFRRADDLAMAMESRCYRGDINRTKMNKSVLTSKDNVAIFIFFCFSVLLLLTRLL